MKPRLLDLYAGHQGAAVGYARAGFDVTATDIEHHDQHPEITEFITADSLTILADIQFCQEFDVITGSPPCQHASRLTPAKARPGHPNLIPPTLKALKGIGRPWVVENVEGSQLGGELTLCGSHFNLGAVCKDGRHRYLRRHRLFASSEFLVPPGHCRHRGQAIGVYGHGGSTPEQHGYVANLAEGRIAMGIDWMNQGDLSQAIPPAYTQWIGEQLLDRLGKAAR